MPWGRGGLIAYIRAMMDRYDWGKTRVRIVGDDSEHLLVEIVCTRIDAYPIFVALVMDALTFDAAYTKWNQILQNIKQRESSTIKQRKLTSFVRDDDRSSDQSRTRLKSHDWSSKKGYFIPTSLFPTFFPNLKTDLNIIRGFDYKIKKEANLLIEWNRIGWYLSMFR